MNKLLIAVVVILLTTTSSSLLAQPLNKKDSLNPALQQIAREGSSAEFIKFKDGLKINPETIFSDYKDAFELGEEDQMLWLKTETDELGFKHYQFQQYYKNVPVDIGIYKVHLNKSGVTYASNGKILKHLNLNVVPSISTDRAIELALAEVPAAEYRWQSEFWQKEIKQRTSNPQASYYPSPKLVISEVAEVSGDNSNAKIILAYSLDIYTTSPDGSRRILIDATTGKTLQKLPLQFH